MASEVTNASASTNTGGSLKRTLESAIQDLAWEGSEDLQPATKRPKREAKLDTLKAKLGAEVALLKKTIEGEMAIVKGKGVADEVLLNAYIHFCRDILEGRELDENDLAIFKMSFEDHFEPEEVLLKKFNQGSMSFHKYNLSAITILLAKVIKLTGDVLAELRGLPEPSAYAYCDTWRVWQKKDTAIVNLRPPTNQGLPIEVLHPAFASFLHDVRSMPPDKWTLEDDVNQVSLLLCTTMAHDLVSKNTRRTELRDYLRRLDLELQVEFYIDPTLPLETHAARSDLCLSFGQTVVLLGEVKGEFETGDPYMQVSRSYQALVHYLESQGREWDGVPCILLVVCGPLLTVAAGFYDGTHIIVEPLMDPCTMLPSRYNRRAKRLAQVLSFMRKATRTLSQPRIINRSPPSTPRIYPTYINSAGESSGLEFIEALAPTSLAFSSGLLFTAKSSTDAARTLLVKLVDPECYNEEVHRTLADEGLAPLLLGTAHVAGAPSAIVMEYLDPPSGWTTLQSYIQEHRDIIINTEHPALANLLKTMREKKVVHGDLRPNNIMCRERPDSGTQKLEVKVVDFDWAGKLGSAKYPAIMNPDIKWPGAPHGVIGENDDETLLLQMLAMV